MSSDNFAIQKSIMESWIENNVQIYTHQEGLHCIFKEDPLNVQRKNPAVSTKNSYQESRKLELKKEFYRIIKDLEDRIKQNKQRLIQDINNPGQKDNSTIKWIKSGFTEEYKNMAEDYKNRYNIRLEKILHTALSVNPKISKDLALLILRMNCKLLMVNEFEAIFITECIRTLGWKYAVYGFEFVNPELEKHFEQCVLHFNFPEEFTDYIKKDEKISQMERKNEMLVPTKVTEAHRIFFNIFLICYSLKNFLNQRYIMNILEQFLEDKLNKTDKSEGYYSFIQFINIYLRQNWNFFNELIQKIPIKKGNELIEKITREPIRDFLYEKERPHEEDRYQGHRNFQSGFVPTDTDPMRMNATMNTNHLQKNLDYIKNHPSTANMNMFYQNQGQQMNPGNQLYGNNFAETQNTFNAHDNGYQPNVMARGMPVN